MSDQIQQVVDTSIPPKLFFRNTYGLIEDPSIVYVYNEDGTINWRKMLKPEHLASNRDSTTETDVSKVDDKNLLILLSGIRYLSRLRGFYSVKYRPIAAAVDYVATICEIRWISNYETEGREVVYHAQADAHHLNTEGIASQYLAATAENRAFVRCVREFLGINIISQEETSKAPTELANATGSVTDTHKILEDLLAKKGLDFDFVKEKLVKKKVEGADGFQTICDIPTTQVFELIDKLKKYKKPVA